MTYKISDKCIGCGACKKKCPESAIDGQVKSKFCIDEYMCTECGTCFDTCKKGAVVDPSGLSSPVKSKDGKDPKALIDTEICAGCKTCYMNCPQKAVILVKKGFLRGTYCRIEPENCIGCGTCTEYCITGAASI